MNKKMKLGIIGLGPRGVSIGKLFAAHPECEIVALLDRFSTRAQEAIKKIDLPDARIFNDLKKMLNEVSLDGVFIAAPPNIQVDMACLAMESGVAVATEVPAATTLEDCWKLVNCVEKTGVLYQLSEQTRYWGFIQEWREMARREEFGKIYFAEGEYMHFMDWDYYLDSDTGEVFYGDPHPPADRNTEPTWRNLLLRHPILYLPHTLSPLLSITGGRVSHVSCMGTKPESYTVEGYPGSDIEIALMRTTEDTVLRVAASFLSHHGPRRETDYHWYQVMGTKRTVEWARNNKDPARQYTRGQKDWQDMNWSTVVDKADGFIKKSGHAGADAFSVNSFIRSVIDKTPSLMDVYLAVETAAPAIIAAESARQGGVLLEVPDFRKRQEE